MPETTHRLATSEISSPAARSANGFVFRTSIARRFCRWTKLDSVAQLGLLGLATGILVTPANAQESGPLAAPSAISSAQSPALSPRTYTAKPILTASPRPALLTRDQMYEDLAEQAAGLNRHHTLLKQVIKIVSPSVAHIEAKKRERGTASSSDSGNRTPVVIEEAGSGIVIQRHGRYYVITNYHVIENSLMEDVRIEADGMYFKPARLMHDRETDLSVMALSGNGLKPARLGDSSTVEIGDFVVAVGSPFGLSHSVSYGIISALNRHDLELGPQGVRYQNFMQTDAAINPGNSGGPLINLRGEIIGINTAIASNSGGSDGIGFTIPMNMAMRIANDLIDYGEVKRGFLGVSLDARFSYDRAAALGLPVAYGTLVSAITPGSPAATADFRVGDVILEFDNQRVANDSHLVTQVSLAKVDTSIPVKLFRDGQYKTVYVNIKNRRSFDPRG